MLFLDLTLRLMVDDLEDRIQIIDVLNREGERACVLETQFGLWDQGRHSPDQIFGLFTVRDKV